jgi:hypothetical protein
VKQCCLSRHLLRAAASFFWGEPHCRSPVSAYITIRCADQLTDEERALLGTPVAADLHRRDGVLRCATGLSIASVTALVVTSRVPQPARLELGIAAAGPVDHAAPHLGEVCTPLGRALHGLGITREQLTTAATPGYLDEEGTEVAVLSVARLWTPSGWPLALVTERVHAQFLSAYPPPWPLARTKARST